MGTSLRKNVIEINNWNFGTKTISTAKNIVKTLLEKYKELGEEYTIYNYNKEYGVVGELKIKELPDLFFINEIKLIDKTLENDVNLSQFHFLVMYHEIYSNILINRRFNKILKIKNNINGCV